LVLLGWRNGLGFPPHDLDRVPEDRLEQFQKLAAIRVLSAGIAHEINNPLAIIRQEAEWMQLILKKEVLAAEELQELRSSVGQVVQQVERCTEIIRNLLDFSQQRQPVMQELDLNRLTEDMARLVEREAKPSNIEIVRQYQGQLPAVYSDAPQLRQIILNLLINAGQAIGRDGAITVSTRPAEEGEMVELVISDTGCGIPAKDLPKIFDPFFTTKPAGQGTGLGLAICHGLIQRLGGRITVESRVGQGATFTVRLPVRPGN
jgi:two-component system NtrC family sensor kinase